MPIWLHIFNPLIMAASITAVLILNFGFSYLASFGTVTKSHIKFALSNIMLVFICAAATITAGYAIMGSVFVLSDTDLQNGMLSCDYSSMKVLRIPIISLCTSAIFGYILSRLLLFKKADFDKLSRTALSISFVIINLPYVLIIPVIK